MASTGPDSEQLRRLNDLIGCSVRADLLQEALTHPSVSGGRQKGSATAKSDYNRLEFVGDRVLGLVMAKLIHQRYPQADAGELAVRFNIMVREESLARVAADMELGSFIAMAKGERDSGGAVRPANLADALEAIIAAIFLDQGLAAAEAFVLRWFSPHLHHADGDVKDAKTTLQEWAAARALATPTYTLVEQSGPPHAPVFTVSVEVAGLGCAEASGASKQKAQQEAARALLARRGE